MVEGWFCLRIGDFIEVCKYGGINIEKKHVRDRLDTVSVNSMERSRSVSIDIWGGPYTGIMLRRLGCCMLELGKCLGNTVRYCDVNMSSIVTPIQSESWIAGTSPSLSSRQQKGAVKRNNCAE